MEETKKCKHCQIDIPKKAKVCPHCRRKQGGKLKWVALFAVAVAVIAFLAIPSESPDSSGYADEGLETLSESEYKARCETISYENIMRNPGDYENRYVVFSGEVSQVLESDNLYSIFVYDADGNRWGCVYEYGDGEPRILEDDNITVYGLCLGTGKLETIFGEEKEIPQIFAGYIEREKE